MIGKFLRRKRTELRDSGYTDLILAGLDSDGAGLGCVRVGYRLRRDRCGRLGACLGERGGERVPTHSRPA